MAKIINGNCINVPYQEKPNGYANPVWRYQNNPIIKRNPHPGIARIFNSAVIAYNEGFIGVFRAEDHTTKPHLRVGHSDNGIDWIFENEPIRFIDIEGNLKQPDYAYDPRLVKIEDTYYVMWCTDFFGPTIGLAKTSDFKTFIRLENVFLPFNRNGVLFPRKINNHYLMLSRPSDSGHTPFGDIFLSESPDLTFWGKHRHVMEKGGSTWWQNLKIGGGPSPIETDEGWLIFYHGVTGTCNGYVYSMGAAILDLENPSIVKYRAKTFLLTPEMPYEEIGFVPNVIFPCATLNSEKTGKIAIYYGAADSYVALAFTEINEVISYIKRHHEDVGLDKIK
jgi:beta-1,4-mannooligosaccharide/beta-1,4-mannosyl-N-acetylglucosamine phosphorylase